jgi:lipid-binding SYLF domain-containing protein
MKTQQMIGRALAALVFTFTVAGPAGAVDPVTQAKETVNLFVKKDPSLQKFIQGAAGYAVFPKVTKGAVGVGGARGTGVLFERGNPISKTTLTQVTVGVQLGGQTYSEIIFFENQKVFNDFKTGEFSLAAQVSAVALAAGAGKTARYQNGVAVFTSTSGGLMFEASVGGQKFSVQPLE